MIPKRFTRNWKWDESMSVESGWCVWFDLEFDRVDFVSRSISVNMILSYWYWYDHVDESKNFVQWQHLLYEWIKKKICLLLMKFPILVSLMYRSCIEIWRSRVSIWLLRRLMESSWFLKRRSRASNCLLSNSTDLNCSFFIDCSNSISTLCCLIATAFDKTSVSFCLKSWVIKSNETEMLISCILIWIINEIE